jgi:hypothetical protein
VFVGNEIGDQGSLSTGATSATGYKEGGLGLIVDG